MEKFASAVSAVIDPRYPARRSLAIVGGTGAGKTHFLRHCQHQFETYIADETDLAFVVVEYQAGTSSSSSLIKDILRRADEACAKRGEYDLITALINSGIASTDLEAIKLPDLRNALLSLSDASKEGFRPLDRDGRFGFDTLREVAKRWLAGGTISAPEKQYLNVSSRLATSAIMTRAMSELFALARNNDVMQGVVLLLDEVEALFASGISTAKIQAFLQDLRFLFDESLKTEAGYSLLIVSASTQKGASNLRDYNYPLFQRLGYEGDNREELHSVSDYDEARDFADVYLDYERSRSEADGAAIKLARYSAKSLITQADIEQALVSASSTRRAWTRGEAASQAQLLEALHQIVERKNSGFRP